jgi:hypothetical protein
MSKRQGADSESTYNPRARRMKPYMLVLIIAAITALADLVKRHEASSDRPGPSALPNNRSIRQSIVERTAL